jgi:hypothetical protein
MLAHGQGGGAWKDRRTRGCSQLLTPPQHTTGGVEVTKPKQASARARQPLLPVWLGACRGHPRDGDLAVVEAS